MSPETYRRLIRDLDLTQEQAGELFGYTGRTGQTWAAEGPPKAVAMLLLTIKNRTLMERMARKACNNS